MPSTPLLDISEGYAAGASSASDKISAAQLDIDHLAIEAWANTKLVPALARVIRDDDTLVDGLVRNRNLHQEVLDILTGLVPLAAAAAISTANVALSALQTIDGYTLLAGDRVLLVGQTNSLQNGPWVAAAGAWVRPADFASGSVALAKTAVQALNGTTQAGSTWMLNAASTVDSAAQAWLQVSGFGTVVPLTRGGTGSSTAAGARTNLGLGALSVLSSLTQAQLAADCLYQVDTIAALKALTVTYATVYVRGYYAPGDGGAGYFRWNAADATGDNGGTVIIQNSAPGTGRFNRILDRLGVYNVVHFGAKPDGVTDCSAAVLAAITAAGATGSVYFPGRFYFGAQVTLPTSGTRFIGEGESSVLIKKDSIVAIFAATAKTHFQFSSIRFEVEGTTVAYSVTNSFCNFLNCHFLQIRDCYFYAFNGSLQPCLYSCVVNSSASDATVTGCTFQGYYGNSTGCLNEGTGLGKRHIYSNNRFLDFVDTGLGLWTGSSECVVADNYFRALPVATAPTNYTRVCIDMAGVSNSVIIGNVFVNGTQQIRNLTNLTYTSNNNLVVNNTFLNPEATTSTAQTCINVSHSDTQEMSITIKNNYFYNVGSAVAPTSNVCVLLTSTNSTGRLTVEVDGNVFDGDATARALSVQGLASAGRIRVIPGANFFKLPTATPIVGWLAGNPTIEIADRCKNVIFNCGGNLFTLSWNDSSTLHRFFNGRVAVGVYVTRFKFGAMTQVAAGAGTNIIGNAASTFSSADNNASKDVLSPVLVEADLTIDYTSHSAGNNFAFTSITTQRIF